MSFTAFRKPGMKEDVHLEVLGTYFTAYSVFLKQHSKFFLKFLDSPDKARPATVPADDPFKGLDKCNAPKTPQHRSTRRAWPGDWQPASQRRSREGLLCYLSGRWDIDPDLSSLDPKLRALVTKARQGVLATIGTAHNNVMTTTLRNTSARLLLNRMYEDIPAHNSLPQYYYEVHKLNVGIYTFTPYFGDVSPLMVNNLRLVRDSISPEQGSHSHYFLCGEVSDEDLPWDTTQLDCAGRWRQCGAFFNFPRLVDSRAVVQTGRRARGLMVQDGACFFLSIEVGLNSAP
ncbi:hypothetical protein BKA61DRAFT_577763 [Leptodontidium sp. MPI-SDFR-AT-0119]|nr:hypothetical protein BKA61DRAFT_577763 [Leptodontidium sp. MPI-SDFR-AT-0119]